MALTPRSISLFQLCLLDQMSVLHFVRIWQQAKRQMHPAPPSVHYMKVIVAETFSTFLACTGGCLGFGFKYVAVVLPNSLHRSMLPIGAWVGHIEVSARLQEHQRQSAFNEYTICLNLPSIHRAVNSVR